MSHLPRSAVCSLRRLIRHPQAIAAVLRQDQLNVYAAQASFFWILSAIPLFMLILNVSHLLSGGQTDSLLNALRASLSAELRAALDLLLEQLRQTGGFPLVSLSALTALWSASRGMAALEKGMGAVYGIDMRRGFLRDILRSLLYTAVFILLIPATLLLLVFGAQIADGLMTALPALERPVTHLMDGRGMYMFLILSLFFTLEHRIILHCASAGYRHPLAWPGAMLSAAGWMLFSYLYSLYIRYFPRSAQVYGSLALLVILMLWLYFCMILFLCGAEVNKWLNRWIGAESPPGRQKE